MKRIAVFCIPAHGHTNPLLPVVTELARRGNEVRFYSFEEFREKIEKTGAAFVSCDPYLQKLTAREEAKLKQVSTTEMTIQDLRLTLAMNDFLHAEFLSFRPDVVYSDSACFWGKLNAWKHDVPLVVSTSTFAFNKLSSQYMKSTPKEMADLFLGMPKVKKELSRLKACGYPNKGLLALIQSGNSTDSVVYTSKKFQPYAESFSDRYLFAGPSVFSDKQPEKDSLRPLVYISLGTVINDRPDFYRRCIEALKDEKVDVIISCGPSVSMESLGALPENVKVFPSVDQLDVLSRAGVFLTHCGMNSVSESLYMAAPMVLYPQTNEQAAVARRVAEIHAGALLRDDSAVGIRQAVRHILNTPAFAEAAKACSEDFRSCPGTAGAADFVEGAPHTSNGADVVRQLDRVSAVSQAVYGGAAIALGKALFPAALHPKYKRLYLLAAIGLAVPVNKQVQKLAYKRLTKT